MDTNNDILRILQQEDLLARLGKQLFNQLNQLNTSMVSLRDQTSLNHLRAVNHMS